MKKPLRLIRCILDLEEVASIEFFMSIPSMYPPFENKMITRDEFLSTPVMVRELRVLLKSSTGSIVLYGEDANTFYNVWQEEGMEEVEI